MLHAHITVGGKPLCDFLGCQAGRDIADKAAQSLEGHLDVFCGHTSVADAQKVAKALRPHFVRGKVKVVLGDCPVLA